MERLLVDLGLEKGADSPLASLYEDSKYKQENKSITSDKNLEHKDDGVKDIEGILRRVNVNDTKDAKTADEEVIVLPAKLNLKMKGNMRHLLRGKTINSEASPHKEVRIIKQILSSNY